MALGKLVALGFVLLAVGCGGSTGADSGSGAHAGVGGSGASGGTTGTGASTGNGGTTAGGGGSGGVTGTGGVSDGFTGIWKGYVENYAFDDGTDTVVLTLDSATAGVSGHVQFGDKALLPPATDPNVGYPPGLQSDPLGLPAKIFSGFAYTLVSGSFDGQRLKFQITLDELWTGWCALQTPYLDEANGGYACAHNWGFSSSPNGCTQMDPNTGQTITVDCTKLALCSMGSVCSCTSQACTAASSGGPSFDMQLNPPSADGSVAGLDGSVHNVHLKKQ